MGMNNSQYYWHGTVEQAEETFTSVHPHHHPSISLQFLDPYNTIVPFLALKFKFATNRPTHELERSLPTFKLPQQPRQNKRWIDRQKKKKKKKKKN